MNKFICLSIALLVFIAKFVASEILCCDFSSEESFQEDVPRVSYDIKGDCWDESHRHEEIAFRVNYLAFVCSSGCHVWHYSNYGNMAVQLPKRYATEKAVLKNVRGRCELSEGRVEDGRMCCSF
ncbi:unnamed protein product [Cunninghamella echinulata]